MLLLDENRTFWGRQGCARWLICHESTPAGKICAPLMRNHPFCACAQGLGPLLHLLSVSPAGNHTLWRSLGAAAGTKVATGKNAGIPSHKCCSEKRPEEEQDTGKMIVVKQVITLQPRLETCGSSGCSLESFGW